jgi:hypothetical protein
VVVSDTLPARLVCLSDSAPVGTTITGCGPTITWTVGTLADDAVVTATITVQVNADSGTIINTATESQTNPDPSGVQSSSVPISPKGTGGATPVPPVHTGEPWTAWLYWLLVGMIMGAGLLLVEMGWRRREALARGRSFD